MQGGCSEGVMTSNPAHPHSSELLTHFKAVVSHLRVDTLQRLIDVMLALISAKSVNHRDLCAHMPGQGSLEAKQRRVERGVHDPQLTMQVFLALILAHLPPGKWLFSLDRTHWTHGQSPMNLLVLGIVVHGYTIPLVWDALEHTGSSDTNTRIWLVCHALQALPAHRWKGLVADRECIGAEWFRFLRCKGIKRAVRIKKDTRADGMRVDEWCADLPVGTFRQLEEKCAVFGEILRVVATRSPTGDLVVIATDFVLETTFRLYRWRWSVECTFSSLKSRGFDLERTAVTDPQRLERLFGLVVLAWLACLQVGVWRAEQQPIKVLKHGRKAMSLIRYGGEHIINALRWDSASLPALFSLLTRPLRPLRQGNSEVVGY